MVNFINNRLELMDNLIERLERLRNVAYKRLHALEVRQEQTGAMTDKNRLAQIHDKNSLAEPDEPIGTTPGDAHVVNAVCDAAGTLLFEIKTQPLPRQETLDRLEAAVKEAREWLADNELPF